MKSSFRFLLIWLFWCKTVFSAVVNTEDSSQKESISFESKLKPSDGSDQSSTPLDLFFAREPQRRSQIETIWKWDLWCQLQPKFGNGPHQITAYYYDAQLDKCTTFNYKGSDGNQNNFKSLVECERHCKGTAYMTLRETTSGAFCGLQPNAGQCLALNDRYYYDVNARECKTFVYGGCGGNQNRFATKEKCKECIDLDSE